jgi:hypothetical protein
MVIPSQGHRFWNTYQAILQRAAEGSKSLPARMLGPPKARDLDRSVLVSLERLIPPDHFYRHLEATLDLCDDAGLIWGKEVLADATKVEANADLNALRPRLKEVLGA